MLAQFYTGRGDRFGDADTSAKREQWFSQCLDKLVSYLEERKEQQISLAFPWKIGCEMAGGNMNAYVPILMNFAARVPYIRVVFVCFSK
jgi:hypothetical protein